MTEEQMIQANYEIVIQQNKYYLQIFNGDSEVFISNDTYQFKDYSMYEASKFDAAHKAQVHAKQFPIDCQRAFNMGVRLAGQSTMSDTVG